VRLRGAEVAFTRIETFNGPFVDGLNWDYYPNVTRYLSSTYPYEPVSGHLCEQTNNRLYLYIPLTVALDPYNFNTQYLSSKPDAIVIGPDNNRVIVEIDWDLASTGKNVSLFLLGNPTQHSNYTYYAFQAVIQYSSFRSTSTPRKLFAGITESETGNESHVILDMQTNPTSGRFKIEISGGYAKIFLDEGSGYWLVHQAAQRIDTTDPYCARLQNLCMRREESGVYFSNFRYSVSPNISEAGKVKITASIAGGKYADAYVYTNNPCQCPLEMNIGIDNETLDLYDGPRQSKIVIAAERAGYPALEVPVQCTNYTTAAGSLQWEWRYLGIDYIDAEKTTGVNEIAGVSQCRVDHFIESVSTVYVEAPDGTPMLVYGNLYAGHNEKTIDLNIVVATGYKLQVSYWAQGIAINYFNALAVGTASIEVKAETGKENPRYLLDTKTITVTDTTPAPPSSSGGGSSGSGSVTPPGTAPAYVISGPSVVFTIYYSSYQMQCFSYRFNGVGTSYRWTLSGSFPGTIKLSGSSSSSNYLVSAPTEDWAFLWVDNTHEGSVTISCSCVSNAGASYGGGISWGGSVSGGGSSPTLISASLEVTIRKK